MSEIGVHGWKNIEDVEHFIERNSSMMSNKFFGLHGETYLLNLTCEKEFLAAYNLCSPLKSIIGKRSKAFNTGVIKAVNPNTLKEIKSGKAADTRKLLKKPNVLQTESQFMAQQNTYVDIFGYCPVLKVRPAASDTVTSLWNIPPWLFDIEYTKKWLKQYKLSGIYKSYSLYWEGEKIEIPFNDLFFIFDDGIGTQINTDLTIPDSRLVSNDFIIANIVAAYKSRNTLITKRGAMGILSNEGQDHDGPVALRPEEKDDLQKDFKKYGLVGQAYQIIISDANLKWQQMGFATKDLMLFEEIQDDIDRLCDTYGLPPVLMARTKLTTYDNQKEGKKSLYDDTIIPESAQRMEMLTNGIIEDGDTSFILIRDFSHLSILQEDKDKAATARKTLDDALAIEYKAGLITKNDWREKLGDERLSLEVDPDGDKYFDAVADAEVTHQRNIEIATARGKAKQPK